MNSYLKQFFIQKYDRVLGGILLIAGSCIGVGMLAVPILSGLAGPIPTFVIIVSCWFYMTCTALLLVEAMLGHSHNTNIISLADKGLGKFGKWMAWITFLSLFMSLIIAYIAKGGEIIQSILISGFPSFDLPTWSGPLLLTSIGAFLIYYGTKAVDHFNRICMYLLFISFFYFLFKSLDLANADNLEHSDWSYLLFLVPFFITSFGFHNMLPTINEYLNGNKMQMIYTIMISSMLILAIYISWIICIQSVIPPYGINSIESSFQQGEIATEPIIRMFNNPLMKFAATSLAFFAIITSLLGQSISLFHFLADGLKLRHKTSSRLLLCALIFVPCFILSQSIPGIFFLALEFAGGISTMILFGIIPSLLVWVKRYHTPELVFEPIIPGGRPILIGTIGISSLVITYEVIKHF